MHIVQATLSPASVVNNEAKLLMKYAPELVRTSGPVIKIQYTLSGLLNPPRLLALTKIFTCPGSSMEPLFYSINGSINQSIILQQLLMI